MTYLYRFNFWLTIVLLSLFIGLHPAFPKEEPFKFSVSAFPESVQQGGQLKIIVSVEISSKYQLYAENTNLRPADAEGVTFGPIKTSKPVKRKYPYGETLKVYEQQAVFELPVIIAPSADPGEKSLVLEMNYQGCSDSMCFMPEKKALQANFSVLATSVENLSEKSLPQQTSEEKDRSEKGRLDKISEKFGLAGILILVFWVGIGASLTPCVYPIIPITISVIGAAKPGSAGRSFLLSLVYVLGLSVVYAGFGVAAAWTGSMFGEHTNHPAVRIFVTAVFTLMGLSMFDVFYLQIPQGFLSVSGRAKGITGVFLTGAASGAVAGPCVLPFILSILTFIAVEGNKLTGFLVMWSFSMGMGVLFLVVGTFTGVAASLPKAGAWMEKLKKVFGYIMFAVALYFIKPVVDERFYMLFVASFLIGTGMFFAWLFPFKSGLSFKERLTSCLIILFLVIGTAALINYIYTGGVLKKEATQKQNGISWLTDEPSSLALAAELKKPVMIDFTASWCKVCLKLDHKTFTNLEVIKESKRFVCVKIDTETDLPEIDKIEKKYNIKGLPKIVFVNSSGRLLTDKTINQFVGPDDLLKIMKQVE